MKELGKNPREPFANPGALDDPFLEEEEDRASILVNHGPFHELLPVVGMSVGAIRARFRDRLGVHPGSVPVLDGRDVAEETIVRTGQVLTFVNRVGEKGRRP